MDWVANNICVYLYKINTDNSSDKHLTSVKQMYFISFLVEHFDLKANKVRVINK